MPITINGDGSITGLAVGGLPDGTVDADTLASGAAVPAALTAARVGAMRALPAAARYAKQGLGAVRNFFAKPTPVQGPVGSSVMTPGKFTAQSGVRIPSSGTYTGVKFTINKLIF